MSSVFLAHFINTILSSATIGFHQDWTGLVHLRLVLLLELVKEKIKHSTFSLVEYLVDNIPISQIEYKKMFKQ